MKEKIIQMYINRLTKNDLISLAKDNGIILNDIEINTLYNTIKRDYSSIIKDPLFYLNNIKSKLTPTTYNKIYELYTIYYPELYHWLNDH